MTPSLPDDGQPPTPNHWQSERPDAGAWDLGAAPTSAGAASAQYPPGQEGHAVGAAPAAPGTASAASQSSGNAGVAWEAGDSAVEGVAHPFARAHRLTDAAWEAPAGLETASRPRMPAQWGNPLPAILAPLAALFAGYVLSLVLVLVAWAGLSLATGDARASVSDAAQNYDLSGAGGAFSVVLRSVVHVMNMALGSRFHVSVRVADESGHLNASVVFPVLLLTLAYVVMAYWAARLMGRVWGVGNRLGTAAMALLGGLVTATVATLLGRLCAFSAHAEGVRALGHTATAAGFFGALALAFVATWAGLNRAAGRQLLGSHPLAREAVRSLQTAVAHFGALGGTLALAASLYLFIRVWHNAGFGDAVGALLVLPFAIGHVMAWGFGQASLGQVSASSASSNFDGLGHLPAGHFGVTVFAYQWWVTLLVILATLAFIAVIGCLWALRRRVGRVSVQAEVFSWVVLPVAYLLGGLLLLVVARVGGSGNIGDADDGNGSAGLSLHLAGWTPFLFMVLGLLVDLAARYLAPLLLPMVPPAWRRVLAGRRAAAATAAPVAAAPQTLPGGVVQVPVARTDATNPAPTNPAPTNVVTQDAHAGSGQAPAQPAAAGGAWPGLEDARTFEEEADTQTRLAWSDELTAHGAPGAPGGPGAGAAHNPMADALTSPQVQSSPAHAGATSIPDAGTSADGMAERPLSPEARRRVRQVLIGLGALAGVAVLIGILVAVLNSTVFTARHKAQDVLAAVASGDASSAVAGMGPAAPTGSQALLSSGLYKQTRDRVTDYTITSTSKKDDGTQVHARTKQDSGVGDLDMQLVKQGHRFGVFNNWQVSSMSLGHVQVQVPSGVTTLTVNGTNVDVSKATTTQDGVVSLAAFPGTYTVKLPDQGKYLSGSQADVPVAWADSASNPPELVVKPNDQFTKDVTAAIKTKLDACATQAAGQTSAPNGCPWNDSVPSDAQQITWKMLSYPAVTASDTADQSGNYSLRTTTQGSVQVRYMEPTGAAGGAAQPATDKTDVSGDGSVHINGDSLEVTFS